APWRYRASIGERVRRCPAAASLSGNRYHGAYARVLERSTTEGIGGMSPVDTEQQDGPSARTVSALVDDATERLAAAGIDTPREDAEAIVADALGLKREELTDEVEVSDEAAAKIEAMGKGRLDRQPLPDAPGRAPFPDLEIAVASRVLWPRKEPELLVEVATKLPQGARVHEV